MAKFKVAYVDESDMEIRKFQRFAHNHFEVVPIKPNPDKEVTAGEVFENNVDAVVSDFDLTDQEPTIHYNGAELISLILAERESFPVFILTSYEADAVSKGDDVNIVYEKTELGEGDKFLVRVRNQIEKYYHKLDEGERRLLSLIEKSTKEGLNAHEHDEVRALDKFIENALDKKSAIPDEVRDASNASQLGELLKKVEDLNDELTKSG
jgi:hypothetical protein